MGDSPQKLNGTWAAAFQFVRERSIWFLLIFVILPLFLWGMNVFGKQESDPYRYAPMESVYKLSERAGILETQMKDIKETMNKIDTNQQQFNEGQEEILKELREIKRENRRNHSSGP